MKRTGLIVLAAGCILAAPALAQETYYVQSATTLLLAKPAMNATVLGRAERGTVFREGARQGNWIKVQYNGQDAWVSALTTTTSPPRLLTASDAPPTPDGEHTRLRSRASAQPAIVAGVKGFVYEDRNRASSGERVDFNALEKMEAVTVTPEELQAFIAQGGQ